MITIKLTNIEDIVEKQKGWFVAHVVGSVVDLAPRVEAIVIDKLRATFAEQGIEAEVSRQDD
jgi:hypothetical protein